MCVHCQFGLQPVRLRRRWVHHFPDTGQLVVCEERNVIRREDVDLDAYAAQFSKPVAA